MKLIVQQYVASLKERGELDAIVPDLLSQMGLNVFSRPGRGTRQFGVDVAAVGSINSSTERVFLFSIKGGNLTRRTWDGSPQALRPSLDEIQDVYLRNHLPLEHRGKPITVVLCFGGDIQEEVRQQVVGYCENNQTTELTFEQWNGDKVAELIERYLLAENLLPVECRSSLRKSLALIDEPEASIKYFATLIHSLTAPLPEHTAERIMRLRQIGLCLWILFAWARDIDNLESPYKASEYAILHAWEITNDHIQADDRCAADIKMTFTLVLNAYFVITEAYVAKVSKYTSVTHGLSTAVLSSNATDVNLALFDILGRFAIYGFWHIWELGIVKEEGEKQAIQAKAEDVESCLFRLISNNPCLLSPLLDQQAIDISLAALFLATSQKHTPEILVWLREVLRRSLFSYRVDGPYPTTLSDYADLIDHLDTKKEGHKEEVTRGSILYPVLAIWAALADDGEMFEEIQKAKEKEFAHCTFQIWFPDSSSEQHLYTNTAMHGASLTDPTFAKGTQGFLRVIRKECAATTHYQELSAIKFGFWPLVLVACRVYRLPVPPQMSMQFDDEPTTSDSAPLARE